jgi:hypothetical protein
MSASPSNFSPRFDDKTGETACIDATGAYGSDGPSESIDPAGGNSDQEASDFILDAKNFIFDCRTRKYVAMIRNGQVFRNDKEETRIAIFVGSTLYDVNGNFLGRLDGCSRSLPIGFRELLEGKS